MVQHLHSSVIDKERWDAAVCSDKEARLYAMSWFLDAVTQNNWNGLIYGDYFSVMPFVKSRKFGVRYCYMPYFAQQFSVKESSTYLPLFIDELKKRYAYGQICLSNDVKGKSEERNNFELSLRENYSVLYSSFSSNHKMNINRFRKAQAEIKRSDEIAFLLDLLKQEKSSVFQRKELNGIVTNIASIYKAAASKGLARLYYAYDADGVAGGAFFVEENGRLYYLLGIAHKKQQHSRSVSYGLLDHVIQEYAGGSLILDFEGSQIASISYFFKGFGAANHPYSLVKWNDLPFFIKWIKR